MAFKIELIKNLNLKNGDFVSVGYKGKTGYYDGQIHKEISDINNDYIYVRFFSFPSISKLKLDKIEYLYLAKGQPSYYKFDELICDYGKFALLLKDRPYSIIKTNGQTIRNIKFHKNQIEQNNKGIYYFFLYYFERNVIKKIKQTDILYIN